MARRFLEGFTIAVEIANEAMDFAMLSVYLQEDTTLFWISLLAISLTLIARVCEVLRYIGKGLVKPFKRWAFARAAVVFVIEPSAGLELLEPTLMTTKIEKNKFGRITSSRAMAQEIDRLIMDSGVRASLIMVLSEDIPELVTSLAYLVRRGSEHKSAGTLFYLSLFTTTLHLGQQLFNLYYVYGFRKVNDFLLANASKTFDGLTFDEAVTHAKEHRGVMTQLVFKGCAYTGDEFRQLFSLLTYTVTMVDLSHCEVTDEAIASLAISCPQLETITLVGCNAVTGEGVRSLAQCCPRLAMVDCGFCSKVTDQAVQSVVKSCRKLDYLVLAGCVQITDDGLNCLARYCPRMATISLHNCSSVTDEGVKSMVKATSKTSSSFKTVDLGGCSKVTDEGVKWVAAWCPGLAVLILRECSEVTDEGVGLLAAACPQLSYVNLGGCIKVTDEGVKSLAERCKSLATINLKGCEAVTDSSLECIAASCPEMATANLEGCGQVTEGGVKHLEGRCQSISVSWDGGV